jgi:signal transduction histidine kinase
LHDRPSDRVPRVPRASLRERWFAGVTANGIALVALICVVNGTRRAIRDFDDAPFLEVLGQTAQLSALGMLVAVPVAAALVVAYNLAPARRAVRYALVAAAVAVSSLVGVIAQTACEVIVLCDGPLDECYQGVSYVLRTWARYGTLSALFAAVFVYLREADESTATALDAERRRALFVQREEEARLRMLQAQIEPHFLFNTLATVRSLYRTDAAAAQSTLDNLLRYLEVALPQMRATDTTLAREATLAEAYLEIQRIRMGRRLAFEIDIPAALHDARLPPMMLLTLVENAIKHGLAPLPEGGTIHVGASGADSELVVRVADTGGGFTQSSGGGTGLANIRARLAGLYGAAARLTLALNAPRGVVATIALPLSSSPAAP